MRLMRKLPHPARNGEIANVRGARHDLRCH
jgi:hypothetical protein